MTTSIKLFYSDSQPMVALYGATGEQQDGWECNLPVHEVINGAFAGLPVEQQVPIAEAEKIVTFTPAFRARSHAPKLVLAISSLVSDISTDTNLAEENVRRIVASMLQKFRQIVQRGDTFTSDHLLIRPRPQPTSTPQSSATATSQRRSAVMVPVAAKQGAPS